MKIAVFGTGYVGLATAVSFSEMGHEIIGVDLVETKVQQLSAGVSTIFEPGLQDLLLKNLKIGRLAFSSDASHAISNYEVIFLCVGTPIKQDGLTDLSAIFNVIDQIAKTMTSYKLIIIKSTVPVGSLQKIQTYLQSLLDKKGSTAKFDLISNPEFLREGSAVEDCLNPYRIIIGANQKKLPDQIQQIYQPLLKAGMPLVVMEPESAEMTKYAANSLLAAKISLMNEFSRLCERFGADIESVKEGVGLDKRIGSDFISAGLGYGGSCFPKDVDTLVQVGKSLDEDLKILTAVSETNRLQRQYFIKKIESNLKFSEDTSLSFWGVTFKPNTDDIREAPALTIIEHFLNKNIKVRIHDPVANEAVKTHFNNHPNMEFFSDLYEVLRSADALIISTEWSQFLKPDFSRMKSLMKANIIFDGRNIYHLSDMTKNEFEYHSVGRKSL